MQKYVIAYYGVAFCSIGMDYSNLKPLYSFDFCLQITKIIIEMNANHCEIHSFLVYFIYT